MNAQEQAHDGCQCSKSELDLFTTPPINISMDRGDYTSHHPIATLTDSAPIEFFVPGSPEEYIDLGRTRLLVRAKITKGDGSNIAQDAKVSTVNLLLHSLFSQVDCKLNEKLVTPSVNTYPYKAYLETILAHGPESTDSWLEAELFHRDTQPMNAHDHTADPTNEGLMKRHAKIAQSVVVDMVGRPHVDIFQQDRYLLNGVDMSLKFIRSAKQFHLMTATPNDFKLQILDAHSTGQKSQNCTSHRFGPRTNPGQRHPSKISPAQRRRHEFYRPRQQSLFQQGKPRHGPTA